MKFVGIVNSINSSDNMQNLIVKNEEWIIKNLKVTSNAKILIGKI